MFRAIIFVSVLFLFSTGAHARLPGAIVESGEPSADCIATKKELIKLGSTRNKIKNKLSQNKLNLSRLKSENKVLYLKLRNYQKELRKLRRLTFQERRSNRARQNENQIMVKLARGVNLKINRNNSIINKLISEYTRYQNSYQENDKLIKVNLKKARQACKTSIKYATAGDFICTYCPCSICSSCPTCAPRM